MALPFVMRAEPALVTEDLSVRFGGVSALNTVSLSVAPGSIHGVIGPNGSGKTTFLNAVCGFVRCSGDIRLLGRSVVGLPPHRRIGMGLGRTFQNPKVGEDLTVRDLLRIGEYRLGTRPFWKEAFAPWLAEADRKQAQHRASRTLDELGIDLASLDIAATSLPQGTLKLLDLARALLGAPKVLLLDECTSGLNEAEIIVMREQMRRPRGNITLIVVEHNVQFLSDVCDHVTVLDAGQRIADGTIVDVLKLPEVVKAYMGEDVPIDALAQAR
jgi:ABC-type branched-subunit amino acid transport system ATPase component